jgi:hypothetical protein
MIIMVKIDWPDILPGEENKDIPIDWATYTGRYTKLEVIGWGPRSKSQVSNDPRRSRVT